MTRRFLNLALILLVFVAVGLVVGLSSEKTEPAEAALSYPSQVERHIQATHYNGRCGAGWARCRYVGRPSVTRCRLDGWCRFINGYYQEWRPTGTFPIYRLYACKVTGWATARRIALAPSSCYRL